MSGARLKHLLDLNDSGVWGDEPNGTDDVVVLRSTDITLDGSWDVTEPALRAIEVSQRVRKILRPGDLILVKSSGSQAHLGKTALVDEGIAALRCTFSNFVQRLRPGNLASSRYLWYLLNSKYATAQLDLLGTTSTGLRNLSGSVVGEITLPVTDVASQIAISEFLDEETSRIDDLIDKKQRLVELCIMRRASEIANVVETHAIEHMKLGRFVQSITQGASPQAEARYCEPHEYGLLKLSAVKSGSFVSTENKALPADYPIDKRLLVRPGDLLVTRSNTPSYVGDVCAVRSTPPNLVLCDLIYRLRLDDRLDPNFAALALLNPEVRGTLRSLARGSSQSMVKLRGEDITSVVIPYCEMRAQTLAVMAADAIGREHDALASRLRRQMDLLRERRQALITAAVTGQLEIPGVSAA